MSDIAINIEGISKKYSVGKEKDGSLRGTLNGLFKKNSAKSNDFWALKDISFDVKKGEVIGIIGKNGAGKSTLLKILSQITKPSEGRIEINGRVASLLEVGTGFHPELTGRENIFLNGTILGMSRKEVKQKFDEIVEFSGVEKFIDTPVKRYSSGMYVRLAFAVAAHLEPEILIIDEVLAVGDAEFQKKCLGKMQDVADQGRTVLFVSHNMSAVQNLCSACVLIDNGKIECYGDTDAIIEKYLRINTKGDIKLSEIIDRKGNGDIKFVEGFWMGSDGGKIDTIKSLEACSLVIEMSKEIDFSNTKITIGINDSRSNRVTWLSSEFFAYEISNKKKIVFEIKNFNLSPGEYNCNLFCETENQINDWIQLALPFSVAKLDYYNIGKESSKLPGAVLLKYDIK